MRLPTQVRTFTYLLNGKNLSIYPDMAPVVSEQSLGSITPATVSIHQCVLRYVPIHRIEFKADIVIL